jgi:hypothetical protein
MARINRENEGEGSRTADAQYRRGVREHVLTRDVEKLAEEAMHALENDEGELAEAEAIGRAKADEVPEVHAKLVDVARVRDEVRVQMHLAKSEAKELFEKLEDRWARLVGKVGAVKDASTETASDLKAATGLVVDELREGYERLKRELTK